MTATATPTSSPSKPSLADVYRRAMALQPVLKAMTQRGLRVDDALRRERIRLLFEEANRLQAAAQASCEATRLANELYTRGLADFLTVLDAQRQQLAVEDDLVQSDTAVVTHLVALYKALGGGWSGW